MLRKAEIDQTTASLWILKLLILVSSLSSELCGVLGAATSDRPICSYYLSAKVQSPSDSQSKDQLLGGGLILCGNPSDYCFSYWQSNGSVSNISTLEDNVKWLARGCFTNPHTCDQETCIAKEKLQKNSYFCCCKGHRCNDKISIRETTESPTVNTERVNNFSWWDAIYVFLYLMAVLILFTFVIWIIMRAMEFRKFKKSQASTPEEKCSLSPSIDLNKLNFLDIVGKGRYGTVYRSLFNDEVVAVKLIAQHAKSIFTDEKYVYSLPLMDHPNLLSYLGGGEVIGPDQGTYLGLVLSYCTRGRLNSYLLENTLDWSTFCRIVISCTRGLGHLHSDIKKGDLFKPCVAHRDFNTRNLLLKDDLTCVVSDLGFAIHTQGSKFFQNGEPHSAEMNSLTEVGTLRYMAPEVLEGAVNLRDCETSLKQIDVYALGLVLWEIASRCHDLYQGMPTPHYALPYQAEVGLHPSFEQMQVLVAKNKARPLFPSVWKDTNPAFRQLKETIEDCWDSDADARLSAMCVERRLLELPELWKRYRSSLGLSSINSAGNFSGDGMLTQGRPGVNLVISNELSLPKEKEALKFSVYQHSQPADMSASEETVETPLPLSPSEDPPTVAGKNQRLEAFRVSPLSPIQPHQGINPCIERNMIKQSKQNPEERLSHNEINNANILDPMGTQLHVNTAQLLVNEHLMPLLNEYAATSHPEQAVLNFSPSPSSPCPYPIVPPIPILQNEMSNPNCQSKKQNYNREMERSSSSHSKGWQKWKHGWGDKLASLLQRRRSRKAQLDEEHQGILVTPASSSCLEHLSPSCPPNGPLLNKSCRSAVPTELINQNCHGVRVALTDPPRFSNSNHYRNPPQSHFVLPHMLGNKFTDEKKNINKDATLTQEDSVSKSSDNSTSFVNSESSQEKVKRPTRLQLQADSPQEDSSSDIYLKKVKLRNPKKRVKTPCHPLVARLSLFDDSIMEGAKGHAPSDSNIYHSLPLGIDKLDQNCQKDSSDCSSTTSTLENKKPQLKISSHFQIQSNGDSIGNLSSKSLDITMPETHLINATKSLKSFTRPILAHV